MSKQYVSYSDQSVNSSVDYTCAFNPTTGELEDRAIIYKPVIAWAVTSAGVVPLLAETRNSSILQARLLPAAPRTFVVYLENGDGALIELGYQSPGASHPDWSKVAQDLLTSEFEASDSASG
jgi:hypothetical protein